MGSENQVRVSELLKAMPEQGLQAAEQLIWVVTELLINHPYTLFLFSDAAEKHWHLVNVKWDGAKETDASDMRFKTQYVRQIPIPQATAQQRGAVESVVRKLLSASGKGAGPPD